MLLKEACTAGVVCCGAQTTVLQAASLMRHKHVGDLVVVDDPQDERIPLGIVTDRDIVVEVLGNELDPTRTAASGSSSVICCRLCGSTSRMMPSSLPVGARV